MRTIFELNLRHRRVPVSRTSISRYLCAVIARLSYDDIICSITNNINSITRFLFRFKILLRCESMIILPPTTYESLIQFLGALNYSILTCFSCKLQQVLNTFFQKWVGIIQEWVGIIQE